MLSAALWMRTQPQIDGARIGVIGFSHGGWTAAWVTQRCYERLFPGLLKAAVDYCGAGSSESGTVRHATRRAVIRRVFAACVAHLPLQRTFIRSQGK